MVGKIRTRKRISPSLELGALVAKNSEIIDGQTSTDSRAPGTTGAPTANHVIDDPDTTKLRCILTMLAEGRTQLEIAEHFGKDPRTVRRWTKEAKRRKLAMSERLTPEEALTDFLCSFAAQRADLLRIKKSAEADENFGLALRCIRELSRHEATRMAVLEKLGLFDGLALGQSISDGPGTRKAQVLVDAAENVLTGKFEMDGCGGEDQEDEDDDEPIY